MSEQLDYFSSVRVPSDISYAFKAIEDILQQEHGRDGRHLRATQSQDGFMSADDKRKVDLMYEFLKKQGL